VFDTVESGEGLGLLVDRREVWGQAEHEHWLAGSIPGWTALSLTGALSQSRYLSDSGRLFFDSPDHLVPAATSGKESVYEYEPSTVGSCESATGGCVSLISSGTSSREAAFVEATPSGDDVFFITAAQLSSQDTDTALDIYDARVCTPQSPCLTPPPPAPAGCNETDACRPAAPAQPLAIAAPAQRGGSGNLTPSAARPAQGDLADKTNAAPKHLTRSQLLARALKSCKKRKRHKQRQRCEASARRRYRPPGKHRRATSRKRGGR
jgi:hypothetical protein